MSYLWTLSPIVRMWNTNRHLWTFFFQRVIVVVLPFNSVLNSQFLPFFPKIISDSFGGRHMSLSLHQTASSLLDLAVVSQISVISIPLLVICLPNL
jgi:hypothetical protein